MVQRVLWKENKTYQFSPRFNPSQLSKLTQKVILGPRAVRGHADDWHHVGVGVAVLAVAIVAVVDGNAIATVADTTAVAEDVVAGGRLRVAVTQAGIDDDVA